MKKYNIQKKASAKKFILLFGLLVAVTLSIIIRLAYIMIVKSPEYRAMALKQWNNEIVVPAKRGRILDRNGNELAVSIDDYRIDIDMNTLRQTLMEKKMSTEEVASKISSALGLKQEDVSKALNATTQNGVPVKFVTLARQVDKSTIDKVNNLKIRGIVVSADSKRYYPNNAFLSHVLGNINGDGTGISGVELSYNKDLSGTPGVKVFEADNRNRQLPYSDSQDTPPIDGKDVMLTIDENIQNYAEKAAQKALIDNKAKAVTITIMNPNTGEILAMVNKPDFNPNSPRDGQKNSEQLQELWKNNAVQNSFEPGSIFKVITAYAAMAEHVVKENDIFVDNGSIKVSGRTINCWLAGGHGVENFVDIIKNSCNVGFVELGQKLGKENLNKYITNFGFGQKTGIDLPGESQGIVRKTENISNVDLATLSFGQGDAVTAVQYLAAFNAIANGGTWIRPHVMKEIVHNDSNEQQIVDKQYNDLGRKKIVDENVASTLRGYLEKVVTEGVGSAAYVDGLHIAGKTGTAQKADPKTGGYAPGKYMSSFAGMAPVSNPKVTMLISIDEPDPSNYYAGQTAAPVAKELFTDVFNYLMLKGEISQKDLN